MSTAPCAGVGQGRFEFSGLEQSAPVLLGPAMCSSLFPARPGPSLSSLSVPSRPSPGRLYNVWRAAVGVGINGWDAIRTPPKADSVRVVKRPRGNGPRCCASRAASEQCSARASCSGSEALQWHSWSETRASWRASVDLRADPA